jgi:2,3-bisphosphoglycerate-independent phosphoglycerate mutase
MVGHSGNLNATIEAIEDLDECFGRIDTALKKVDGELLLTADHGNADQMIDEATHGECTSHSLNPVPFIYVGRKASVITSVAHPNLTDVAPSLLALMGLPIPEEMTGKPLFKLL